MTYKLVLLVVMCMFKGVGYSSLGPVSRRAGSLWFQRVCLLPLLAQLLRVSWACLPGPAPSSLA